MPFQQRPAPGTIASKAKSLASQIKPPASPAAAIQAAKKRAQTALGRIRGGAAVRGNPLFQEYIESLMSETAEGAALKDQLVSRARQEFDRRRGQCQSLAQVLRPLQSLQTQMKFRQDVLRPARTRSVTSKECWSRVATFLQPSTRTPVLDWLESLLGPMTFGFGAGAEGGAGAGVEGAMGIAVRRVQPIAVTHALTVALGAYAEATASIYASVAGGNPASGDSVTMDVSVSAASGVSGEIVVSLTPTLHRPKLTPEEKDWDTRKIFGGNVHQGLVVDYAFAGIAVSLGTGAGLGGAIGFTGTSSILLSGPAT
jgi:hypothetical protein